jgi:hypothetical protein
MTGEQMPEGLARGLLGLPADGNGSMGAIHLNRTNAQVKAAQC